MKVAVLKKVGLIALMGMSLQIPGLAGPLDPQSTPDASCSSQLPPARPLGIQSFALQSIIDNYLLDAYLRMDISEFERFQMAHPSGRMNVVLEFVNRTLAYSPWFELSDFDLCRHVSRLIPNYYHLFEEFDPKKSQKLQLLDFDQRLGFYLSQSHLDENLGKYNPVEQQFLNEVTTHLRQNHDQKPPLERRIQSIDNGNAFDLTQTLDQQAFEALTQKFEQEHALQELIWLFRRAGKQKEAEETENRLRSILTSGKIQKISRVEKYPGSEHALIEFSHGIKGVFTAYADYGYRELAAYEMDRLAELNIVPLSVEREIAGKKGSLQIQLQDAKTAKEYGFDFLWILEDPLLYTKRKFKYEVRPSKKLRLLNFLLLNPVEDLTQFQVRKNGQQVASHWKSAFRLGEHLKDNISPIVQDHRAFDPGEHSFQRLKQLKRSDLAKVIQLAQADPFVEQEIFTRIELFIALQEERKSIWNYLERLLWV
ncbi:MAG: hypothetical protein ACO3A2_05100 [Bdellovibrionia bacterium]